MNFLKNFCCFIWYIENIFLSLRFKLNIMTKFDKIVKKLGWRRLYKNIGVYISKKDAEGFYTIAFPTQSYMEDFDLNDEKVSKKSVSNFLYSYCCHTKFIKEDKKWISYLLIGDYFAHKREYDNELIWAKKAMKENSKLTSLDFSKNIRELL